MPAHQELARRGIFVEPTSAMVWAALDKHMGRMRQPVVLVMTGSGLKYTG
jgi:threonine synthase